jgi:type II secretory pathway component PulC
MSGSATPPSGAAPGPAPAPTAQPEAAPQGALTRSQVHRVVTRGFGAFLQNVMLEDRPVMADGKFKGFRIAALNGNFFRGADLAPGDVVMRVNGFSVERPEQALEAFRSLEVASELRVEIERAGAPRELRYAIVEDGAAPPLPPTTSAPLGPPAATSNLRSR